MFEFEISRMWRAAYGIFFVSTDRNTSNAAQRWMPPHTRQIPTPDRAYDTLNDYL